MTGHLELVCARSASGAPYLRHQHHAAPFHLSKPFQDAGVLVVNLVAVSPGVLDGDALRVQASVEEGAALVLTAPSATRLHRSREGSARLVQSFTVGSGAWLEVHPEVLIPQAGSRFEQHSAYEVASGGTLLAFEALTPGRVASGEAFVFDRLAWETRIRSGDRTVVLERAELAPDRRRLAPLRHAGGYYGCAYAIGPAFDAPGRFGREPDMPGVSAASGRLAAGGWVHKALADDAVALRHWLTALRARLYAVADRPMPAFRRT